MILFENCDFEPRNLRLKTPRGEVKVDVHAIDEKSVDRIEYIVECKNWSASIPQSVVHSFTTVMQETGANIGFIVSKKGLQSGAIKYTKNTNVIGLTYQELQDRYFNVWWHSYFCYEAAKAADVTLQYVEPFNTKRERFANLLSKEKLQKLRSLQEKYSAFVMLVQIMDIHRIIPQFLSSQPINIELYKQKIAELLCPEEAFTSKYYRGLLGEICLKLYDIENQFNTIFGKNIFKDET